MSNELQELMKNNPEWYKDLLYRDVKVYIKDNINSASRSFVAIGYYLKYIRDNQLYSEDGYTTIWEFAQGEFNIGKSSASSFMSINDKFSVDGNSPILLEQYRDFTSSKLAEMLTLSEEQLDQVTPVTTRTEIREMKQPVKEIDTVLHAEQEQEPITIDDLDFTVRTYNCLKRAGIDTIDELCELTRDDVIKIRNMGRKCLDEINEKLSEVGRGLKQNHQLPRCTHEADTECNMINIKPIAESLGMDCNGKCCWGCKELCGARCNASAHRPEATGIVSIEPEENRIPDPDLSCKFDPDAKCLIASKESCKRINDDRCMYSSGWDEEDYITVDPEQSVELDSVETVEADIIQTEPEERFANQCADRGLKFNNWLKANNFSIAQIVSDILCDIPLANDKDPFLSSKVTNRLISSLIIKTDAYYSYLTKELDIEPEPVKSEQPELPILRNNDQRKEFIEAYETWPIWIDQELTGEKYYRYDFDNGDSMVVKVYYCKVFDYKSTNLTYEERFRDDWGKEEYYLLEPDKYFKDCETNKSALVDYLKEIQKKGAN